MINLLPLRRKLQGVTDVLVVEDDDGLRANVTNMLRANGLTVAEADTCDAAIQQARAIYPITIIVDLNLPDGDALELLPKLLAIHENAAIFVVSGYGTIDAAVKALK